MKLFRGIGGLSALNHPEGNIVGSCNSRKALIRIVAGLFMRRIKDEAELKILFSGIRKEKPVVVYTTSGVKASLFWFALEIMGYDAKPSTWQEMSKA
ncbi:Uncharacterised protein [uncultured archaeon]|nr:Uncharacterised protein [uncultured archaeon]